MAQIINTGDNAITQKKRIAVLVSGSGTNLQAIIDSSARGELKSGAVCLVISNKRGVFALERARAAGIAADVIDGGDKEEFCSRLRDRLETEKIDLIILAGFLVVLTKEFTDFYKNRIINVHPSLIPAFCGNGFYGLRVHSAALERGVRVSGATVHFVNEITDGGPIILQHAVEVKQGDTPQMLQRRIMEEAEWKLLPLAAELFCAGRLEVKDGRVIIKP